MISNAICVDTYNDFFCFTGPTTVTLRGYEWITYNMYDFDTNLLTDRIRFSLQFKVCSYSGKNVSVPNIFKETVGKWPMIIFIHCTISMNMFYSTL